MRRKKTTAVRGRRAVFIILYLNGDFDRHETCHEIFNRQKVTVLCDEKKKKVALLRRTKKTPPNIIIISIYYVEIMKIHPAARRFHNISVANRIRTHTALRLRTTFFSFFLFFLSFPTSSPLPKIKTFRVTTKFPTPSALPPTSLSHTLGPLLYYMLGIYPRARNCSRSSFVIGCV